MGRYGRSGEGKRKRSEDERLVRRRWRKLGRGQEKRKGDAPQVLKVSNEIEGVERDRMGKSVGWVKSVRRGKSVGQGKSVGWGESVELRKSGGRGKDVGKSVG